jgi:hypothetical protein
MSEPEEDFVPTMAGAMLYLNPNLTIPEIHALQRKMADDQKRLIDKLFATVKEHPETAESLWPLLPLFMAYF